MKPTIQITVVALLLAVVPVACNSETSKTAGNAPATKEAPAPAVPGMPQGGGPPMGGEQMAGRVFVGTVLETMNSGGYTYVQVDDGKEKIWAAAPEFKVKKGEKVTVPEGMPMQNYHSSTLNRDFPVLYFVGAIGVGDQPPAAPAGMPPAMSGGEGMSGNMPEGLHPKVDASQAAKDAKIVLTGIKKADKNIGEIFASQADLRGKEVTVRGKVVKYNPMVMGKNWLHIQDGSGSPGTNDLTITTALEAKVGDTVLVKGVITIDKDFGMGYRYDVIIEDAKITVE